MSKYKLIFSVVALPLLIVLVILIWRTSQFFTYLATLLSNMDVGAEFGAKTTGHEEAISLNESPQITDIGTVTSNFAHYETIDESIARIQRNVIVTGTIIGIPGQESAIFQIEGMPDRHFNIDTQLMDGFIITEISENRVTLKNQVGHETFSMKVQHSNP